MDKGNFLPIEDVIGDISLRVLNIVPIAQVGCKFIIDIEVNNDGPNVLSWDQQHPINISYRWFDMTTCTPLVLNGHRTLFRNLLHPHTTQKLQLLVTPPHFCGMATLRISCVCEGRFWFYEQFATGWADLDIKIVDPHPWPAELKGSLASRALRGSVAARALRASLTAAPIHCLAPLPIEESAPKPLAPSADENTQHGFKFSLAPVEALSAGPLDASPPATWQSSVGAMPVAEIGGWRSWLRHPFATFERYLNQALVRSSLGRRLEASQRATEELLERLRQSAQNDLHTQFMLREMNSNHERRDAFYAENHCAHLDLLQQELSSFFHEKVQALSNIVADGLRANEAARLDVLEQQQALGSTLRLIVDASRRLQLGQLKVDEDLMHIQDQQADMAVKFDAIRQFQLSALSELQEAVLSFSSDTCEALRSRFNYHEATFGSAMADVKKATLASLNDMREALEARLGDHKTTFDKAIEKLPPFKEAILASVHDAHQTLELRLSNHEAVLGDAVAKLSPFREAVLASMNETQERLKAGLSDHKTVLANAAAGLLPLQEAVLASVNGTHQALEARLSDHEATLGDVIANLVVRYNQDDAEIRAALMELQSGRDMHAGDLEHLTGDIAGVRDFLHTNFPYMFAKVDALLHRQVFPATGSGKIVCRNAKGLFAIPEGDLDALAYFTAGQLPEPGSLTVVERLLQPGDTFVDVGANVGLFSVVAGRRVGNTGSVLSFEPVPETMSALTATVQLNGLANIVSLHQNAAGRKAGTAKLYVGRTCGHSSLLPLDESKETIEVSVVALDDVIGDRKVDLIKIDVEGWELEVLQGLRNTLANNSEASVLLELGPSHVQRAGMDLSTWISRLQAAGMTLFEIDEDSASVTPLRTEGFEGIVSINLLLSKKSESHLNQG